MAKQDDSIFSKLSFIAPASIGLGLSVSNILRNPALAEQIRIKGSEISKTYSLIQQFVFQYGSNINPFIKTRTQNILKSLTQFPEELSKIGSEEIKTRIYHAASMMDPSGQLTNTLVNRLQASQHPLDVLRVMSDESSSIYFHKTVSKITQDIKSLFPALEKYDKLPDITNLSSQISMLPTTITPSQIDPKIMQDIRKMQQLLGADIKLERYSRQDQLGEMLKVSFLEKNQQDQIFNLKIAMPIEHGVIQYGTTQQSRYITGQYGLVEGGVLKESFNHAQWTARRALEDLIPEILHNRRSAYHLASKFHMQMLEDPEWVPTMPKGIWPALDDYIEMRSKSIRLYKKGNKGVEQLSEKELFDVIEKGTLGLTDTRYVFPGFGATQASKGVVITDDYRRLMSLVPEAASFARKPGSFLKYHYQATEQAIAAMNANPINNIFRWMANPIGPPTPLMRTTWVSPEYEYKLQQYGLTTEGQILQSANRLKELSVSELSQLNISKIRDLAKYIDTSSGSEWTINKVIEKGVYLGDDPAGRPVVSQKPMKLLYATAFENDLSKGNFIRLMVSEDINQPLTSKVFGAHKAMRRTVPQSDIINALSTIHKERQLLHFEQFAKNTDTLAFMDILKKERNIHYEQMFSALWEFSKFNMEHASGFTPIEKLYQQELLNFMKQPHILASKVNEILKEGNLSTEAHTKALEEIIKMARLADLDVGQIGRTFGAVPYVFGKNLDLSKYFNPTEISEINKGIATGVAQYFFGGKYGPGSGGFATIEPRMFEFLGSQHYGELGKQLQEDIAQRMIAANPHKVVEQYELAKALQSVIDPTLLGPGTLTPEDILNEYPTTGKILSIPKVGNIYVPGSSIVSQISEYKTTSGQLITNEIQLAYQKLAKSSNQEEITDSLKELQQQLFKNWIGTVTGENSLTRGRLPGSMFLTSVIPTISENIPEGTIGITRSKADEIFGSLYDLGIYNPDELKEMQNKFLRGEAIYGLVGRHPYIGAFSNQPTRIQLIEGSEPLAVIKEKRIRALALKGTIPTEKVEQIANITKEILNKPELTEQALKKLEQQGISAELLSSPLRISAMPGLAGDFDADMLSVMVAGPQLQTPLEQITKDQALNQMYEDYAIRSQLLKAKASGEATISKIMAGDVIKIAMPKKVGLLSNTLQDYRAAILQGYGNLSTQERLNALGFLEWMEQTPISGKHIAPGKELEMVNLMVDIQNSFERRNIQDLTNITENILSKAKDSASARGALEDGLTLAMEDYTTGQITMRHIKGLDYRNTIARTVEARMAMHTDKISQIGASKIRRLVLDKAQASTEDMLTMLKGDILKKTPFGAFFLPAPIQKPTNVFSSFSEEVLANINRLGSAGKSMIANLKPLALGTTIGLGLSAILSEPPKILPPGSNIAPQLNIPKKDPNNLIDDNLQPESQPIGEPEMVNPLDEKTARIAPAHNKISIKSSSKYPFNPHELSRQIRNIQPNSRINTKIRDNRKSMTPQKVSALLRGE